MLNFCIFVFVFYALLAIVRMLIDYTLGVNLECRESKRRKPYEKNYSGIRVSET